MVTGESVTTPTAAEHAGNAEEHQIRDRERRFLSGTRDQLIPNHRVGRLPFGLVLGVIGPAGQHGVEEPHRDRAAMVQVQRLEPVHNVVRRFASDVGRDLVARRLHGCAGVHDDVGDTGFAVEDVEHRFT
jgi:hypothetical protein